MYHFSLFLLVCVAHTGWCQNKQVTTPTRTPDVENRNIFKPAGPSISRFGRRGVLNLEDRIAAVFTKVANKNSSNTQDRGRLSMGTLISTMLSKPEAPTNPTHEADIENPEPAPKPVPKKTTTEAPTPSTPKYIVSPEKFTLSLPSTNTPHRHPVPNKTQQITPPPRTNSSNLNPRRNGTIRLNTPLKIPKIPQPPRPYYRPRPANNATSIKINQHKNLDLWKIITNPEAANDNQEGGGWRNGGRPGINTRLKEPEHTEEKEEERQQDANPRQPYEYPDSSKPDEEVLIWAEVSPDTTKTKGDKVGILLEEVNRDHIIGRRPPQRKDRLQPSIPTSITIEDEVEIREAIPFPEPGPIWDQARREWGVAWEIHVYPMAALFLFLAAWCTFNMFRINSNVYLLSKGYFISLNCLMVIIGTLRSITMFHDAYNLKHNYPPVLGYLLFNIVFPCITSSFAIIFLSLLHTTRVQWLPSKIQNPSVLMFITAVHFVMSFSTDIIVGSVFSARALLLVCQCVFLLWALLLASGYFYIFSTLYNSAQRTQNEMMRDTFTRLHIGGQTLPRKMPRATLGLSVKIVLVTAVLILMFIGAQLYGMIGVYGIMNDEPPLPWPWWCYQFTMRALEIVMCYLMAFVASQPLRKYEGTIRKTGKETAACSEDSKSSVFSLMDCGKFWNCTGTRSWSCGNSATTSRPSEVTDDIYPTICSANQAVRNYEIHNGMSIYEDLYPVNNVIMSTGPNGTLPTYHTTGRRSLKKSSTLCSSASGKHSCCLHASQEHTGTLNGRPSSMLLSDGRVLTFKNPEDANHLLEYLQKSNNPQIKSNPLQQEEVLTAFLGPEGVQNTLSTVHTLDNVDRLNTQPMKFTKLQMQNQVHTYEQPKRPQFNSHGSSIDTADMSSNDALSSNRGNHSINDLQRVYASTCSSESAGHSFDVHLYNTSDQGNYMDSKSSCRSPSSSTGSPYSHYYTEHPSYSVLSPYSKCPVRDGTSNQNANLVQYIHCISPSGVPYRVPVKVTGPADCKTHADAGKKNVNQIDHPPGPHVISRDRLSHLSNSDLDVNFLREASAFALRMPELISEYSDSDVFSSVDLYGLEECADADDDKQPSSSHNGMLRLNLPPRGSNTTTSEDITPDSAVVSDISYSGKCFLDNRVPYYQPFSSCQEKNDVLDSEKSSQRKSIGDSLSDVFLKLNTQSLNDLLESSSGTKAKRGSRGLLNKLKSSNFSLNLFHGYSPLNCDETASHSSLKRCASDSDKVEPPYSLDQSTTNSSSDGGFLSGRFALPPPVDTRTTCDASVQSKRIPQDKDSGVVGIRPWMPHAKRSHNAMSPHSGTSSDWGRGGTQGQDCEYGESDVTGIDPAVLKARILNVCSEIKSIEIAKACEQRSVF